MTCDTENKTLEEAFQFFCTEIQPRVTTWADKLNRKLVDSPFVSDLDSATYGTYLRNIRKSIDLFREANVPLQAELSVLQQQYGQVAGAMTIEWEGKTYTLQQASQFLLSKDRSVRESVYQLIQQRRIQDRDTLNTLFDRLLALRHRMACQAGFDNYIGYRYRELGRFDYGPEACDAFHRSVKEHVLPLVAEIHREKQRLLALDTLRPWDLEAEPEGIQPLQPFRTGDELLEKTIACFARLDPFFADCLVKMKELGHLDLESRKGKAPGGYNCPLAESGAPFIFMNAAGQMDDVTTMVHEGGHAVHSFLSHPLALTGFKEYPMEMAEVASMSMELFSMEYWDCFFSDPAELKRAKLHQLERVITIFPWIAVIDKFQHWIYAHPAHTEADRVEAWTALLAEFNDGVVDFSGCEPYRSHSWQRQLHLYEVPFYYIEYGIAQLGAIGMWMQYKKNPRLALENYCRALSRGGMLTLPELYATAGLTLDFSPDRIRDLMAFVQAEMKLISDH